MTFRSRLLSCLTAAAVCLGVYGVTSLTSSRELTQVSAEETKMTAVQSFISRTSSDYGYNYLGTLTNGKSMQALYKMIYDAAASVWNDSRDFPQYTTGSIYYEIGTVRYASLGLTVDEARKAFLTVRNDCPMFYYLSTIAPGSTTLWLLSDEDYRLGSVRAEHQRQIFEYFNTAAKKADGLTSEYAKALFVNDALISDMKYSWVTAEDGSQSANSASWAHNVIGAAEYGEGVCESYAKSFQALGNYIGLDTVYVLGKANGGDHAWNMVKLEDGNYYYVDCTWDDPIVSGKNGKISGYENEKYMLVGDDTVVDGKKFSVSHPSNKTAGGIRRIARLGTDSMQIFNLGGFPDTIVASYDAATGTATLRPQLVYNHAIYGPIWFCKVDYDQKVYDNRTTATIGGQVDDKGNISIGGWGLFVVSGQYKGYAFAAYSQSDFYPCNATASATIVTTLPKSGVAEVDSTTSYPVYIYQTADNEAVIMNFANTGNAVNVMLNADKSVDIAPQVLFTNAVYGNFMGYAADIDNAKYMLDDTYIKGTGTEQSIKLGNWSIGIYSSNMLARVYRSTEFTFNSGIVTYPAAKALDWSGTGTEADPYVIATPAQLEAFAESVNLGTSYKDKYVKLGTDIDMAGRPGKWRPAGMYDGKSFDGILDGDNHTISHVSFEQGNMPYSGIIGNAGAGSVIKNLTADSVTITTRGDYASCIVGYSAGTLTNLKVTQGYVKSYGLHSGLVVGYLNEGAIDNCTSAGYIAGYGATGGVAGYVEKSNLTACSSSAKVEMTGMSNTLYRGVGGVVGDQVGGQLTESYFAGTLNDKIGYSYAGGVIGSAINDTIDRCYNAGVITTVAPKTSSYSFSVGVAGGVVGMTSQAEVTNCYNSNLVMDTKPTEKVGGIVGYVSAPSSLGNWKSHFYNCYNSGQVLTPSMTPTQGIYGYCKDFTGKVDRDTATFFNCYYDVQVNGYTAALNVDSLPAHALLTASMTAKTALDGLSTDNWVYTSGLYPRLKGMETTQAAKLSASPMLLTRPLGLRR